MSDLISRQAILKHIEKIRQGLQMMDDTHRTSIIMNGMHLCEEAVRNQPSAKPKQKVGKWISQKGGGYKCSECGRYALDEIDGNFVHVAVETPYCPFCGKKMEEQDEISD